jgi:hypothetical protein
MKAIINYGDRKAARVIEYTRAKKRIVKGRPENSSTWTYLVKI